MLSFLLTSLIRYHEKSPISKKIKALYHFWGRNINNRIKIYKGAKRLGGEREIGRNDSGSKGKVGETTRGRNDSGRKGKWAKRLRGERESGRNDPDSFRSIHTPVIFVNWKFSSDESSFTFQMKCPCLKTCASIYTISFYPLPKLLLLKYPNASKIIWGTGGYAFFFFCCCFFLSSNKRNVLVPKLFDFVEFVCFAHLPLGTKRSYS